MKNQPLLFSRTRTYEYLKCHTFTGVSAVPPSVGTRHDRWSYHWSGIHPKCPYLIHHIAVSPDFRPLQTNYTHELKIECQKVGDTDRRLLYLLQLDLASVIDTSTGNMTLNTIAEQLACAMVLFLLRLRAPSRCPGVVDVPHQSQVSGWAIAVRETLQGMANQKVTLNI